MAYYVQNVERYIEQRKTICQVSACMAHKLDCQVSFSSLHIGEPALNGIDRLNRSKRTKQAALNTRPSSSHMILDLRLLSLTILGAICTISCFLCSADTSSNAGGLRRRIFGSLWRLQGLGQHKLQHRYAHFKDAESPQSQSICAPFFSFVSSTGVVLLKSVASFNNSSMLRARECKSFLK